MSGWIKLHRKILDNEIWQDVTAFRLFTVLLLNASHQDGIKINGIIVNRGQYLRSYSKLAEDLSYLEGRGRKTVSKSTIFRNVQKLDRNGMVSFSETDSGTLFTITNYEQYQGFEDVSNNVSETDSGTKSERSRNEVGTKTIIKELKNKRIKTYTSNETLVAALLDFVEMRNKIKAPLTDRAYTMLFNKLDELSNGQDATKIEIINQSIMNCWKGIFQLQNQKGFKQDIPRGKDLVARDIEIARNKWIDEGNDPSEFKFG